MVAIVRALEEYHSDKPEPSNNEQEEDEQNSDLDISDKECSDDESSPPDQGTSADKSNTANPVVKQ